MFLKAVIFYDYDHSTDKDTTKSVSGLVDTLRGTTITCLSNTQRTVTLIRT